MASRIEGYDEKIIECAQKEFLEKGYSDASLRNIAGAAGVSTSTIYTRFKDKAGLFQYLVEPAYRMLDYMKGVLEEYFAEDFEYQRENFEKSSDLGYDKVIDMIYADYPAFKLLVTRSPGDMYREYVEEMTSIDMKYTLLFLKGCNSRALREGRINEGFCHVVSIAFFSALFHCVDDDMTKEEAQKYIRELRAFYQRGWEEYFLP